MFRFLYVTDLHGWEAGYEAVAAAAATEGIGVIVNGGDLLPKGGRDLVNQPRFLAGFLAGHLAALAERNVQYFGMFGNDDMRCFLPDWRGVLERRANARDLTDRWHDVGEGLVLRGCPYVPDPPFGLKDWAVLDGPGFRRPVQFGPPVLSTPRGYQRIGDVEAFFRGRPTLERMLEDLAREAPSMDGAILVAHAPPAGMGMGCVFRSGQDVGSPAVRRWIETRQPLLTLHGHIHESPELTGVHTARLGRSVVHQPGQSGDVEVTFSVVEIEGRDVRIARRRIEAGR